MEEELDPEVIKTTQISLGKYIKRPPLSEKLLRKPPFRFLHDIITTILKTTGFFEGLFDENELISDNVKDRDSKISFLNKAITVISLTTEKTLSVKPSKIVAGQEPTRTNELLQCLASALDNNLTSHEAVKRYKENGKKQAADQLQVKSKDTNKPNKKGNDSKKNSSKSQNLPSYKRISSDLPITKKDKEKANDTTKKKESGPVKNDTYNKNTKPKTLPKKVTSETNLQSQSKTQLSESKNLTPRAASSKGVKEYEIENNEYSSDERRITDISMVPEKNREMVYNDKPEITPSISDINLQSTQADNVTEIDNTKINYENSNDIKSKIKTDKEVINESIVYNSRKNSLNLEENIANTTQSNNLVVKSLMNDSANDTTPSADHENNARLSTPIKHDSSIARPASMRPSSSRPGAPRPKEKFENIISDIDTYILGKVNIIAEFEQNEEEDDSSIIIIDKPESLSIMSKEHAEELTLSANEHGHLVQQILDSQKEFSQVTGKTEIEWQFGAQKAIVAQHEEVELLRYNIQALTRVTNPLGKLLDHIQEDVEVMRQELQQWSNIYEEVSKEIHKENALSEDYLLPLHSKLKQLELDIREKCEKINDLKVLISKNSSRIEKLLTNGSV